MDADQQAQAANLGNHIRIAVVQARDLLAEVAAQHAHMLQQRGLGDFVEGGQANCHGQGIAAPGRAMRPEGHAFADLIGGQTGPHREAAAQSLGQDHHVGLGP